MDPARKRRVRMVVALSCAVLLVGALAYTSFSAASTAVQPSQLLASTNPGESYQLTGKVVDGSVIRTRDEIRFRVRDRTNKKSVAVSYIGAVPDPFREGREVIITVRSAGAAAPPHSFIGEKDTLITKCPSKFREAKPAAPASGAKKS